MGSTLSSLTRSGQASSSSPTPTAPSPSPSSAPSPSPTTAPTPSSKPSSAPHPSCPTPPVLPRRPKVDTSLPNFPWRGETLDTSGESGYSTDNSDKESLRSHDSGHASLPSLPAPPPPLPRRKPRRKVQFDSYVLLIQALKDRDLKGILSTIFSVSPEALCTEDVIYHFHTALLRQDLEVAELLVRAGAEVNTFDHRGWSALHCAASLARLDMIKLLLMNGAAVLARTHTSGHTPSQLATGQPGVHAVPRLPGLHGGVPGHGQQPAHPGCGHLQGVQGGRADDQQGRPTLCNPERRHRGERRRAEDVVVGEELAGHGGLRTQRLAGTQLKAQLVHSAASVIQRNHQCQFCYSLPAAISVPCYL